MSIRYFGDVKKQLWAHTKIKKGPLNTKCWVWTGCKNKDGYGRVRVKGKAQSVHVVGYTEYKGPLPPGQERDHLCRVRACWRPIHIEPVTHQINMARGINQFVFKSRCLRGHLFNIKNTYWRKDRRGRLGRTCKRCDGIRHLNFKKRKAI